VLYWSTLPSYPPSHPTPPWQVGGVSTSFQALLVDFVGHVLSQPLPPPLSADPQCAALPESLPSCPTNAGLRALVLVQGLLHDRLCLYALPGPNAPAGRDRNSRPRRSDLSEHSTHSHASSIGSSMPSLLRQLDPDYRSSHAPATPKKRDRGSIDRARGGSRDLPKGSEAVEKGRRSSRETITITSAVLEAPVEQSLSESADAAAAKSSGDPPRVSEQKEVALNANSVMAVLEEALFGFLFSHLFDWYHTSCASVAVALEKRSIKWRPLSLRDLDAGDHLVGPPAPSPAPAPCSSRECLGRCSGRAEPALTDPSASHGGDPPSLSARLLAGSADAANSGSERAPLSGGQRSGGVHQSLIDAESQWRARAVERALQGVRASRLSVPGSLSRENAEDAPMARGGRVGSAWTVRSSLSFAGSGGSRHNSMQLDGGRLGSQSEDTRLDGERAALFTAAWDIGQPEEALPSVFVGLETQKFARRREEQLHKGRLDKRAHFEPPSQISSLGLPLNSSPIVSSDPRAGAAAPCTCASPPECNSPAADPYLSAIALLDTLPQLVFGDTQLAEANATQPTSLQEKQHEDSAAPGTVADSASVLDSSSLEGNSMPARLLRLIGSVLTRVKDCAEALAVRREMGQARHRMDPLTADDLVVLVCYILTKVTRDTLVCCFAVSGLISDYFSIAVQAPVRRQNSQYFESLTFGFHGFALATFQTALQYLIRLAAQDPAPS
jgi:hypothetical protein